MRTQHEVMSLIGQWLDVKTGLLKSIASQPKHSSELAIALIEVNTALVQLYGELHLESEAA